MRGIRVRRRRLANGERLRNGHRRIRVGGNGYRAIIVDLAPNSVWLACSCWASSEVWPAKLGSSALLTGASGTGGRRIRFPLRVLSKVYNDPMTQGKKGPPSARGLVCDNRLARRNRGERADMSWRSRRIWPAHLVGRAIDLWVSCLGWPSLSRWRASSRAASLAGVSTMGSI